MNKQNQTVFALASFLLQYPDEKWQEEMPYWQEKAKEIEPVQIRQVVLDFFGYLDDLDGKALEENYVRDFDFSKNTNLYLTNYDCNEACQQSRELIRYQDFFADNGFDLSGELPDYLPAVLELCSAVPDKKAYDILRYSKNRLEIMRQKFVDGKNAYVFLLDIVLAALGRLEDRYGLD